MPGNSWRLALGSVASSDTLRVAVSIFGSMAVNLPGKCDTRISVGRDRHHLADLDGRQGLLRHGEVDVDRVNALQRHDLVTRM